MTDIEALCAAYLSRLDAALGDRSVRQRRQIVEQITEHLHEARNELPVESESAVRSILERLGSPEDIASTAALGDASGSMPNGPWSRRVKGTLVLALGITLAAVGLTVGLLESKGSTPSPINGGSALTPSTVVGGAPATVTVPVVLGDSVSQATVAIQSAGLNLQGVTGSSDGLVDSEEPIGGSRVASGSEVTLHVQPTSTTP